jgi:hypothetical protein
VPYTFIVIKNGRKVVAREDTRRDARHKALELLAESPNATFESGKLDRLVYTVMSEPVLSTVEEDT